MKDILKYVIWTGLYGLLLVPFIVGNSMFFPYITGKAFVFRIIVEIIFALWLILILKDKEYRAKWSWIIGSAVIFVFVLLLADINAVAPHKAFWSNYERMEGFVTFIHLLAYLLVIGSMFNTAKLWHYFLRVNVIVGFIMAVVSLQAGKAENIVRIAGPLGNPIYISVYFLFIFFFTLILLYRDVLLKNLSDWFSFKKVFYNPFFYLYLISGLVSLFVVYRTSRGSLLGAIGGIWVSALLVYFFQKFNRQRDALNDKKVIRHIALIGLIVVTVVVMAFFAFRKTDFVKSNPTLSRFSDISWSNVKGQARQLVWPMALKGFKEKPILGWGQEGFNYVFNKYYDPRMYGQESWFDRAHNAPLDFLIAGGILGFLSYLSLFISVIYLLWFKKNTLDITERALISGLLAGYLFQAIFVFDNLISYIMFFTTLAYVYSRTTEDNHLKIVDKKDLNSKKENQGYILTFVQNEEYQDYIIVPIIVVLTVLGIYWINIPSFLANQTLIQAIGYMQANDVSRGLTKFKSALAYKSHGDAEIREQIMSYTPAVIKSKDISQEIKNNFLDLAITELENQIDLVPNDARYYILTGTMLNSVGAAEQAIPYIKKAIELSPQKQAMRFELVQAYYTLGRSVEAMAEAKSAYELDKNFEQARSIYKITVQNEMNLNPKFRVEGKQILEELGSDDKK